MHGASLSAMRAEIFALEDWGRLSAANAWLKLSWKMSADLTLSCSVTPRGHLAIEVPEGRNLATL